MNKSSLLTGLGVGAICLLVTGCAKYDAPYVPQVPPALQPKPAPKKTKTTQVGRYLTIKDGATKAEINPLLAVSTFTFPPSVYTVGDAINQVLATTGYQLAPKLSPQVTKTLNQPLPLADRKLGPMRIQTALEVLMGAEVYTLQRDPLNRLVNFKIRPDMAQKLGVDTNE